MIYIYSVGWLYFEIVLKTSKQNTRNQIIIIIEILR